MFSSRTKQRISIACASCAVYILLVTIIAMVSPRDGKSFVYSFSWWLLGIPVGLLAYAVLELFGAWSLNLLFWQRMPSWGRIMLLVVLISIGAVGVAFIIQPFAGMGVFTV